MGYIKLKYEQVGYVGISLLIIIACAIFLCYVLSKTRKSTFTSTLAKWTHTANGNFLLAGIGIVWASLVSVFGTQLQQQWFNGVKWENETLIFGISVTLALIMSFLHYIQSQNKELLSYTRPSYEAVKENGIQSLNLMRVVDGCIHDLKLIYVKENNTKGIVFGNENERDKYNKTLDHATETAIESILIITRRFIEGYDDINLKANVFNLLNSKEIYEGLKKANEDVNSIFSSDAVTKSPFFLFSSNLQSRLEQCDYILVCEKTLSCQLDKSKKFSKCIDTNSLPLCMPFSLENNNEIRHPNLFGAPEVITNKNEVYIENILDSVSNYINDLNCSTKYKNHMTVAYENAIRSYYEKDSDRPKSLISFPIYNIILEKSKLSIQKEKEDIMCVLNIYANRVNFMENKLKAESLYALLNPMLYMLGVIISLKKLYTKEIRCYNEEVEMNQEGE